MISIDVSFILVILNFIFLLVVLTRVMYKPLKSFLTERQQFIVSKMESAKQAEDKAKELADQRQAELNNAMDDARVLRDKAKDNAEAKAHEIKVAAEEEADRILKNAEQQILRERDKVMGEIGSDIAAMVTDLSGKFMAEKIDSDENTKIINNLISNKES